MSAVEKPEAAKFEEIPFHGNTLRVAVLPDGSKWVSVTDACHIIGVDLKSQHVKLMKDERFNPGGITMVAADGRARQMLCLNLRQFGTWLLGIQPTKIVLKDNEEEQARRRAFLIQLQEEGMEVLYKHFFDKKDGLEGIMKGFEYSLKVAYGAQATADLALAKITAMEKAWGTNASQSLASCKNWKN